MANKLRAALWVMCGALSCTCPIGAAAQGCSQCRDNVEQSNPAVQAGYRRGIELLAGTALLFCGTAVIVIRRSGR